MHDYRSGLNLDTFHVTADVELDGVPAGQDLAARFRPTTPGVWEWRLARPVPPGTTATLTVSVADRQGNETRVARRFQVGGR
jgi:hypothetical protein